MRSLRLESDFEVIAGGQGQCGSELIQYRLSSIENMVQTRTQTLSEVPRGDGIPPHKQTRTETV